MLLAIARLVRTVAHHHIELLAKFTDIWLLSCIILTGIHILRSHLVKFDIESTRCFGESVRLRSCLYGILISSALAPEWILAYGMSRCLETIDAKFLAKWLCLFSVTVKTLLELCKS